MFKVYHPDFKEGFQIGKGSLSNHHLVINNPTGERLVHWPLSQLELSKGGASNSLVIIRNNHFSDYTLYTRNWALLRQMAIDHPNLKLPRKNLFDSGFSLVVLTTTIISLLLVVFYINKDPLINSAVDSIPLSWEKNMGDLAANQIIGLSAVKYAPQASQLQALLTPLFQQIEKQGINIKLYIVENKTLNAFAIPGGHIVFHTGLLKKSSNLEMIYGVAAHELAHVTHRHGIRTMIGGVGVFVVVQTLLGDLTGLAAVFANNSQVLLKQFHSREAERDADNTAIDYLKAIDLSGRGLYDFFNIMLRQQSEAESKFGKVLGMLSTHPATEERMNTLKAKVDRTENWLDTDNDKQSQWKKLLQEL